MCVVKELPIAEYSVVKEFEKNVSAFASAGPRLPSTSALRATADKCEAALPPPDRTCPDIRFPCLDAWSGDRAYRTGRPGAPAAAPRFALTPSGRELTIF